MQCWHQAQLSALQEGTWNKVGMIRKIMEDTPPERAEWIVYMQPETFFDDTTFAIPFDSYRDRDLILIGNQTALRQGQMRGETSSLRLLLKNDA